MHFISASNFCRKNPVHIYPLFDLSHLNLFSSISYLHVVLRAGDLYS